MKRITIVAVLLLLVSCKKDQNSFIHEKQTARDRSGNSVKLIDAVIFIPGAYATVVVKKDGLPPNWLDEDADGTLGTKTNKNLKYTDAGKYYFVNLNEITGTTEKITYEAWSAWLKKNKSNIDYDETGMYVEETHKFSHPENIPNMYTMDIARCEGVMTVQEIIDAIGKNNYDNDRYDNYIGFDFSSTQKVKTQSGYVYDSFYFSIPMLKSIFAGLDPANKIAIGYSTMPDGKTFTFLWVVGTKAFYNYSNEPR